MQVQVGVQLATEFLMRPNYSNADYSIYGNNIIDAGFPSSFRAEYGVASVLSIGLGFGLYQR
jgi:hypothetical protein